MLSFRLKLKLKGCIFSTSCWFLFKAIVGEFGAQPMTVVSPSQYLWSGQSVTMASRLFLNHKKQAFFFFSNSNHESPWLQLSLKHIQCSFETQKEKKKKKSRSSSRQCHRFEPCVVSDSIHPISAAARLRPTTQAQLNCCKALGLAL